MRRASIYLIAGLLLALAAVPFLFTRADAQPPTSPPASTKAAKDTIAHADADGIESADAIVRTAVRPSMLRRHKQAGLTPEQKAWVADNCQFGSPKPETGADVGPGKDREFYSIPVFKGPKGHFVWAVPIGASDRPENKAIADGAAPVLRTYTEYREKYIGDGKPGVVELLRDLLCDQAALCAPGRIVTQRRGPASLAQERHGVGASGLPRACSGAAGRRRRDPGSRFPAGPGA